MYKKDHKNRRQMSDLEKKEPLINFIVSRITGYKVLYLFPTYDENKRKEENKMARPTRCRRICAEAAYDSFRPDGIPNQGKIILGMDEYEAIRLMDLEKCTQEQCAAKMGISRTTAAEIYETARGKLADCIVNGKQLVITGGHYRLCEGDLPFPCKKNCRRAENFARKRKVSGKGEKQMRVAVTYENGMVFQHFGHTEQFKFYDVEDGTIVKEQIVDTNGQGHGALAGFLTEAGVEILICGGIGGGAKSALSEAGIQLYGGVSGNADEAVKAYLADQLNYNPDVTCSHHKEEGHSCGEHSCGEEKHGCAGNGHSCH